MALDAEAALPQKWEVSFLLVQAEPQRRGTLAIKRWACGPLCACCPARHTVGAGLTQTLGAMKNLIADKDLAAELLPPLDDPASIFAFAMTFDGYEHFGSAEAAGANARAKPRASLTDLRNELFISSRRSRHQGSDEYLATYKELLPLLQKALDRG